MLKRTLLLCSLLPVAIGCKDRLDIVPNDYEAIQQKIMVAIDRCDQEIRDEIKKAYMINPNGLNQDLYSNYTEFDSLFTSIFRDIEALLEIKNRNKAKTNEVRSRLIRNFEQFTSLLNEKSLECHDCIEHLPKVNYLLSKWNISLQEIYNLAFHLKYLHHKVNSQFRGLISKDTQSHYSFTPIVIPERNILKPGQMFRAKITLAIVDNMYVNNFALVGNDSLTISHGRANISKTDLSKGKYHLKGQINTSHKQNPDYSIQNDFQLTITVE
jgi:hypothetical protein